MAANRNQRSNNSAGGSGQPQNQRPVGIDWDVALIPSKRLIDAFKKDVRSMSIVFSDGQVQTIITMNDGRTMSVAQFRAYRKEKVTSNALETKIDALKKRIKSRPELKNIEFKASTQQELDAFLEGLPPQEKRVLLMPNKQYQSFRETGKHSASRPAEDRPGPKGQEDH